MLNFYRQEEAVPCDYVNMTIVMKSNKHTV